MSKAFTREDDTGREADLPERVISPHTNLVTAEGLAQIEATIARLTKEQGRAREVGDVTAELAHHCEFSPARPNEFLVMATGSFLQCIEVHP